MTPRRLAAACCLALALGGCGRSAPYWYTPDGGEEVYWTPLKPVAPINPANQYQNCNLNELVVHPLPPTDRRPIDVLFVVDDSPSMADDQQILAANFVSFIQSFESAQVDFHIGAVTTDMTASNRRGQLVRPYLTPQTPDLEQAFRDMVNVGDKGSAREQGLAAALAALTEPLASTTNAGLVRPDADFALIWLTDENDSSPQGVNQMVDFLKTFKSDPEAVTVAGILDFGGSLFCGLGTNNWKYAKVIQGFGSHGVLAVCNANYAKTLDTIGGRIVKSRCIIGLKRAITDFAKVRITVNGTQMPFTYTDPDALYPNGSIELETCPVGGGTLEIEYLDCP